MDDAFRPVLSPRMSALYLLAIAVSTPFILLPAARSLPCAKLVTGLVDVVLFIAIVVPGMRNGELKRTLPQVYRDARGGRRVAGQMLQTAAIVAASLAMWLTY